MRKRLATPIAGLAVCFVAVLFLWRATGWPWRSTMSGAPDTVLWAWERPEDLRFADPKKIGVAFLAKTILIGPQDMEVRPRMQPLQIIPGTWLMAVARIESVPGAAAQISRQRRREIAAAIVSMAELPGVRAVQVDYDARLSDREFYSGLLADVRAALPPDKPLSITALASWCLGDPWLTRLPVDEAVPMLFQMGPETTAIRLYLKTGGDFSAPLCRSSRGVATNEPLPNLPDRRVYLWNPRPWSAERAFAGMEGVR